MVLSNDAAYVEIQAALVKQGEARMTEALENIFGPKNVSFAGRPGDWTFTITDPENPNKVLYRETHIDKIKLLVNAVKAVKKALRDRNTIRNSPAPGRNDPCPCGSGKKYKNCCA